MRAALVGLTCPDSMVGLPALSLPCGSTPDGLPVGLQLVGRRHGDMALLELAQRVQYTLTGPAAAP